MAKDRRYSSVLKLFMVHIPQLSSWSCVPIMRRKWLMAVQFLHSSLCFTRYGRPLLLLLKITKKSKSICIPLEVHVHVYVIVMDYTVIS